MSDHHGKTWTEVHGKSAKQVRQEKRAAKQQRKQYQNFGKVNWDAFSHRQMWDMVQTAKPQNMYDKADDWSNLAGDVQETTGNVQNVMQKLMTTWRGSAAVTASESNSRLTEWGGQAGNTAVGIGTGLKHYADAVSHAQATMPVPVDYVAQHRLAEGYAVNVTDPTLHSYLLKNLASDHMATQEQAKTAKAKAVKVMEGYENRSQDVHQQLPDFQQAPSMAPHDTPVGSPSQNPGGSPGTKGDVPPNGSTPPGTGTGTIPSISTSPSYALPPSTGGATGYPPGTSPYPGSTSGLPGTGGVPVTPGAAGFEGAGAVGPYGGRGGVGLGGASGAGAAAEEGAAGAASRSGAGPLGGGGAAAAASEEAAAARGAAGRGGMGGMYPPMGGGAHGDGDGEHHNKYDEGLDLFDDIPPAYPSVFGA